MKILKKYNPFSCKLDMMNDPTQELNDLQEQINGKANKSHTHSGSDITSGTLNKDRIPSLPANKITSGTFDGARIPNLSTSKITSGTFDGARIPNLSTSKITSGTFALSRIPTGTSSSTVALGNHIHTPAEIGAAESAHTHTDLQNQIDGKAEIVHTHDYAPSNHTHTLAEIGAAESAHTHTDLQSQIDGKAEIVHTHDYAPSNHTHTPTEIGAAESTHTHQAADITDLQAAISAHTHIMEQITDLPIERTPSEDIIYKGFDNNPVVLSDDSGTYIYGSDDRSFIDYNHNNKNLLITTPENDLIRAETDNVTYYGKSGDPVITDAHYNQPLIKQYTDGDGTVIEDAGVTDRIMYGNADNRPMIISEKWENSEHEGAFLSINDSEKNIIESFIGSDLDDYIKLNGVSSADKFITQTFAKAEIEHQTQINLKVGTPEIENVQGTGYSTLTLNNETIQKLNWLLDNFETLQALLNNNSTI